MTTRRQFAVQLTSLAALGTGTFSAAQAQQQSDLARLLVGFPPGGSTDNVARRLAEKLRGTYAANVLVDNKPGAGTQIAVSALKDAVPDGTTLLLSPPSPFTVYPYTYRKLPYALEDVAPVSMACTFPFALAVGRPCQTACARCRTLSLGSKPTPARPASARQRRAPRRIWCAACWARWRASTSPTLPTAAMRPGCRT